MPTVGCVMPVYNGERFLAEAVESVFGQTIPPDRLVIVDDGSTDGTADLARSLDAPVEYVFQKNSGAPRARNLGATKLATEFLTFMDSDDLWVAEKTELQLKAFEENPDLGLCWGHAKNFWENELKEEEAQMKDHRRGQAIPAYVTPTLMIRRSLFEDLGGFSTELKHGDSMDLYMRATQGGAKSHLLEDVLLLRRMHETNTSRTSASDSMNEFLSLLKRNIDQTRDG